LKQVASEQIVIKWFRQEACGFLERHCKDTG